ncbi:hypothetical protein V6000_003946 [Aspergillus fumigatus]
MGLERPFSCKGYGGGDIFVGGARPFGMVKLGTDTTAANRSIAVLNGGWTPGGNVTAITRSSFFTTVNILDNLTYSQPRVGQDPASVGHYKSQLQNSTQVELSASSHSNIVHYSFPQGEKRVVVDVSHWSLQWLGLSLE